MTDASPLGSVDKALLALQHLSDAGAAGLSLARLADQLQLNKASLHRTLGALRYRGFVEQDPVSSAYRIGPGILALADTYYRDGSLRALLHDALRELSLQVRELCHLGTLSGDEIVYVDKVEPQRAIRVWSEIGRRSPATTTALGRAMLSQSFDSFEAFASRFQEPIPARTSYTRNSLQALWEEVAGARERGFAKEEQENEQGISCIAVAINRADVPIAAISITALHERMNEARMRKLVEILRATIRPSLPPGLYLQAPKRA